MQILEDHQYGLRAGQTSELTQERLERFFLLALWGEVESRVAVLERHGEQLGQQLHVAFRRRVRRNERLQFLEPHRRRLIALEIRRPFELGYEREQSAVLMMRRAEIPQSGVRLTFEALSECLCQPRFSNPWLR
jgi:hypothetical protein